MEKFELESLLKLKRNEMPTEAFWDSFDSRLQTRLAQESMPKARISWLEHCLSWLCRSPLISATCALPLLIAVLFFNAKKQPRYVAMSEPISINESQISVLAADLSVLGLEKNVIQKKMVASNATNCFSF